MPSLGLLIRSFGGVDADIKSVTNVIKSGQSIAVAPGGIQEMFVGYPKAGCHPDEEVALLSSRKGFLRLCVQHNIPVVPVYVFGCSKLLRRLEVYGLEYISRLLLTSIVVMFGKFGLPIPFKSKLKYVMGSPIYPMNSPVLDKMLNSEEINKLTDSMHETFCEELIELFDRNKGGFNWGHKKLKIV